MTVPGYVNPDMNTDSLVTPVPAVLMDPPAMGVTFPQAPVPIGVPSPLMSAHQHPLQPHQQPHHIIPAANHAGQERLPNISGHSTVPQPVPIPTAAASTSLNPSKKINMTKRRRLNDGSSSYKDGEKSNWAGNVGGGDLKKGRFSKKENEILMRTIEEYCKSANIDKQALAEQDLRSANIRGCWTNLAACLPNRSSHSIYGHAIRMIHAGNHKGRWSEEEVANLNRLVSIHGNKWKLIVSLSRHFKYLQRHSIYN